MKFDVTKLARLAPPRFVAGATPTTEELRAVLRYQNEMQWQHNRLLHGYGIVAGLEATIEENENGSASVVIAPGYALDGWGRELVVHETLRIPVAHDRRDFVVFVRFVESDADDSSSSRAALQTLFEPPAERMISPAARADFAIPLARFRRPHLQWQHDKNFRPPRVR